MGRHANETTPSTPTRPHHLSRTVWNRWCTTCESAMWWNASSSSGPKDRSTVDSAPRSHENSSPAYRGTSGPVCCRYVTSTSTALTTSSGAPYHAATAAGPNAAAAAARPPSAAATPAADATTNGACARVKSTDAGEKWLLCLPACFTGPL